MSSSPESYVADSTGRAGLWTDGLRVVLAAIAGWAVIECDFLSLLGFENVFGSPWLGSFWALLAISFGGLIGRWFSARAGPLLLASVSLDLAVLIVGFARGGASAWPIAFGVRIAWLALALFGVFIGRALRPEDSAPK